MKTIAALFAGFVFGLGLTISQMINPAKVIGFLNVTGTWDPSLLLVMGSALFVTTIGYKLIFRRKQPFFDQEFHVPVSQIIDRKLLGGATLFGIGWGLAGFCPGPAITALAFGAPETIWFVAAMLVGMFTKKLAFD